MGEVFPFGDKDEVDLISRVLRFEGRASANELLRLPYFKDMENKRLEVKEWIEESNAFDPYFDYLSLIGK